MTRARGHQRFFASNRQHPTSFKAIQQGSRGGCGAVAARDHRHSPAARSARQLTAPDRSVDWRAEDCIGALREAQVDLAVEGWTPLDAAIDWIGACYPDPRRRRNTAVVVGRK